MASDSRQRVLLTLDCGSVDEDALRALKLLGDNAEEPEVTGLYVEDEDLLNAAQLPGLTEVSPHGELMPLSLDSLSRRLAEQAERARTDFEALARRAKLNFRFQIARGRLLDTLLAAAARSDLVVISRSLRSAGLRTRHGSHFEPLVRAHRNLLFVNEPWRSGSSIVALCEGLEGCERPLAIARRIASAEELEFVVAVPANVDAKDIDADRVVVLPEWTEQALVSVCEAEDARLLVLPPTEGLDWRSVLLRLVDRLSCSLLRLD